MWACMSADTGMQHPLQVCPMEAEWVEDVLPKLRDVDVERLSGGATAAAAAHRAEAAEQLQAAAETAQGAVGVPRKSGQSVVDAGRERYLARRARKVGAKAGRK